MTSKKALKTQLAVHAQSLDEIVRQLRNVHHRLETLEGLLETAVPVRMATESELPAWVHNAPSNPAPTDEPVVYRLPGQPPTERHVRAVNASYTWVRARDGRWFDLEGREWAWTEMLEFSDLELVPLTPEENADAVLYGPPGARWGVIGDPCPYPDCLLWTGHTGVHKGENGTPLGVVDEDPMQARITASITAEDLGEPCNCGRPSQHRPGCNRYKRISGGQS